VVYTLSETLEWLTPGGRLKVDACFKPLKRLEGEGIIRLPVKQEQYSYCGAHRQGPSCVTRRTERQLPLGMSLAKLGRVRLRALRDQADRALWNKYVECYHCLGYSFQDNVFGVSQFEMPPKQGILSSIILKSFSLCLYKRAFGYRQRYFIAAPPRRVGCVSLSGASKARGARDR
jgi:hypothetical protein